jgi:two-component system, NarL family, response regulator YdfI
MNDKAESGGAIRVLVSAPTAVQRAHLESIVRGSAAIKLAGGIYGLDTLPRLLRELQPDVVLADIDREDPQLLVRSTFDEDEAVPGAVVLCDDPKPNWAARALQSGVKAILSRDATADDILYGIQAAFSGLILLEPELTNNLLAKVRPLPQVVDPQRSEELTRRENEILRMLAEGLANKAIAARLGISEHTVKYHISSVLAKLGTATRTEAVTQGIRSGLIVI